MEGKNILKTAGKNTILFPLRNSVLAVMVIFSILINAFIPRFAVSQDDLNTLSQIIEQQSTLLRFFSLSSIPLKIVDELFSEGQSLSAGVQKSNPEKKKEREANSSSDFSIISTQRTLNTGRSNLLRSVVKDLSFLFSGASGSSQSCIRGSPLKISPHPIVFCLILMLFFMLPRSSINDNIARLNRFIYTQLGFPSWVFYCLNNGIFGGKTLCL